MCRDDKKILMLETAKRRLGRPSTTWVGTMQKYIKMMGLYPIYLYAKAK